MKYLTYALKKLVTMIFIIFIVSIAVFFLLRASGVDPVTVMIGEKQATDELRESLRQQFDLDKPLFIQYGIWIKNVLSGDLGIDYINKQSINELILSRIPVTTGLVVLSSLFGMTFAIVLGVIAALNRNKTTDRVLTVLMLFLTSIPNFVVSILVIVFCTKFIPGYSFVGTYANFAEYLSRIFVPSLVMSLGIIAMLGRITRSSMISQLQAPHILTANAKGMDEFNVTFKHAFHNAVLPVLTIAGLQFAGSVGGTVLIEQIFSLPGVGGMLVSGIQQNNYPVVQILVLFMLVVYLTMSFVVDLLYAIVDPRVKLK